VTDSLPQPGHRELRSRPNGSNTYKRGSKFDDLNPEAVGEQINKNMNYQSAMNALASDPCMQGSLDINYNNPFNHHILEDTQ